MLRLVSITGITLAMVIGFLALSSQMSDDYYMRTEVAKAVTYLKAVANIELECSTGQTNTRFSNPDNNRPAVFSSVNYEMTEHNSINVVGVFNNVNGESGKLRIKQGRKFTLNCTCDNGLLQCKRGFTDINKNLIPHIATEKKPSTN